jgi:AmmeMemoRadiSam system protein B
MYSGAIAGKVFSRIKPAETYVLLGPNHTGMGPRYSLSGEHWQTPLGLAERDKTFSDALKKRTSLLKEDTQAHSREHSIEVQLPFIQWTSPEAKIVPIAVMGDEPSELAEIGRAIAKTASDLDSRVVLIASSDMTHHASRELAKKKDSLAIERMLKFDAAGLIETVEKNDISMCGYLPAAIMLYAAVELRALRAELVAYSDSGEVTGDDRVVGYAGLIVH